MARFDVHAWPAGGGRRYALDVQADLLGYLRTRLVVPLVPLADAPPPIRHLNPTVQIEGESYALLTQAMASAPTKALGETVISLRGHEDNIKRALDILLTGL
jgi:toxin CcdB